MWRVILPQILSGVIVITFPTIRILPLKILRGITRATILYWWSFPPALNNTSPREPFPPTHKNPAPKSGVVKQVSVQ